MDPVVEKALTLLRDASWGGIGVIVGIVLHIMKQRRSRERTIAHRVASDRSLPHPLYGSVRSIIWKMWNCGSDEVLKEHFAVPIEFSFGRHVKILDARVSETMPSTLKPTCVKNADTVVLHPILLNSRESITLEFLLVNNNFIRVNLRIAGKTIDVIEYRQKTYAYARRLLYRVLVLFVLWFVSFLVQIVYPTIIFIHYVSLSLAFLFFLFATMSIFYYLSALLNYRD